MNKLEIYEHLANIYLDSSRKGKRKKNFSLKSRRLQYFIIIGIFVVILSSYGIWIKNKAPKMALNDEVAFVIQPNAVKINYNFDVIKKEIYSIDLNNLNLSKFSSLDFSARKTNPDDVVYLRVELTSVFNEISEVYIKDIKQRWKNFKIAFSEFKDVTEWSDMAKLSFIVEEWNTKNKNGVVYIDDIKFIR